MTHKQKHSHRHHDMDDADSFKRHQLRAQKRKKIFSKVMTVLLTIIAILVVAMVFYVYTH